MQTITIAGKLGADAIVRSTQGGDSVCSFSVAVDQRDGRDKSTNWWRVSLWGKRGEALAPYLLKGTSVTVTGDFALGDYEGKPQLNIRANGIALHGGLIPYTGTFLTFSDYSRNALRMAALMKINPLFVFTHDSIGLGEDGPTHQSRRHGRGCTADPCPCWRHPARTAWRESAGRRRRSGRFQRCR